MQTIPVWKIGVMVGTTGAVTVGGWWIGGKYKHPWVGAAVAFFFVAPIANTPMVVSLANELAGSAGTATNATPPQAAALGVQGTGPR